MVDIVSKAKIVANDDLYSDIDLLFSAHPITGDVSRRLDSDAIKRSIKNIVLTNYFERPFKPSLGGGLRNMLFELDTDRRLQRVQKQLKNTIESFEPRIKNVFITLNKLDNNELSVTVNYSIKSGQPSQQTQFNIRRTR